MLLLATGIILLSILIYKLLVEPVRYWNKLEIPHPEWLKFLYLNWVHFFKGQSAAYLLQEMYQSVPNTRYHGFHQLNIPQLILKDPHLIKEIAIKNFDHFSDRWFHFADSDDPLIGQNLLALKGQKWHDMRAIISPSFTTNKMKHLFQIMDSCGKRFVQHFLDKEEATVEIEMQDIFTRYTNDVIATSVFGAEVDSLKDPNNEFYLRGREATDLTKFPTNIKLICFMMCPRIYRMLGLQLFSKECSQFFLNLVNDSIKLREEGKIAQMDMMQLLIEAKQEYEAQQQTGNQPDERQTPKTSITTEDINSQAFTFFFAGFESVARTLCFMAHELAVNPDVQQRLREEIGKVVHQCHEKLTYDILMEMKYLDMVVAEVLRKYPIQIGTDRICTKPYVIEPSTEGEKPVHIPAGLSLAIPTYSLHHDPRLFPNPEKFDPERFSDENKSEIEPYAYQPFGIGPRICIGSRFALMEIKLVVFHLLAKFEIVPVEKTKIPLVYKKSMLTLSSEYGFWLGLKRV